jgi:hypothetical protein
MTDDHVTTRATRTDPTRPEVVVDSGVSVDTQCWNLSRIYTIHDDHDRSVRLWVDLHHDSSYPRQSHYRISRWDGAQWHLVLCRDPHTDAMTSLASAYLPREIRLERVRTDADRVAEDLLRDVLAVIGDPITEHAGTGPAQAVPAPEGQS